ncbi:MAG: histidine phosphatase family protein [Eubacterium sp.]|jgi:alpha-ribazole phosphatase|nr:histidine phosphatase family protein [Eubacterium sp.]
MKLLFIRHGETLGNAEKRYIGITDENLSRDGKVKLKTLIKNASYPTADRVYTSSLKRATQTAELIYPGVAAVRVSDFRECDFGDFEGRNYVELNGDPSYQIWIDSGGEMKFPNGESRAELSDRVILAFEKIMKTLYLKGAECTAFVVHKGTIMSIMDRYAKPERPYFDWSMQNGHGFICEAENWVANKILIFKKEL